MELEVVDLSVPGWRASPASVATMSAELAKVMAENFDGETIIIYQLFDNLCYRACDSNGNKTLPVRGDDGKYHLPGKLVLVDREEFRDIFMDILSLLRAGADSVKILLTPLMRYVKRKCCDDPGHIINKGSFGEEIGEGLNEICSWLRNMAFTRRIRNFTVMDPNETMLTGDDIVKDAHRIKKFWKEDPVHMTPSGYKKLGKMILESLLDTTLTRAIEKDKKADAKPARHQVDWAERRPGWVKNNDSAVHRRYNDDIWKRGRGYGGGHGASGRAGRGGRGGRGGQGWKRGGGRGRGGYRSNPY
jgi:hypothetical protein